MGKQLSAIFNTFEKISTVSSRTDKEQLLRELQSKYPKTLKYIFNVSTNPYIQLYITVLEESKNFDSEQPSDKHVWEVFRDCVEKLETRKITGNNAQTHVNNFLVVLEPLYRKWFARIINKSLRIGVGAASVNKLYPGLIPSFDLQLCETYNNEKLDSPMYCEPKLDGERGILIVSKDGTNFLSRNGKPLGTGVQYLIDEAKYLVEGVYDGELFAGDWNATMSRNKVGISDKRDLVYKIFDYMPGDEWEERDCTLPLKIRKKRLKEFLQSAVDDGAKYFEYVPHKIVRNQKEIKGLLDRRVKQGYEGLVLKDPNSFYEFKRSKSWRRVVKVYTVELPIIGVEEGKGKFKDQLGALIADFDGTNVEVGSGFNDDARKNLWRSREELTEYQVEIEYRRLTTNKQGTIKLLFPVFKRLRTLK